MDDIAALFTFSDAFLQVVKPIDHDEIALYVENRIKV